MSVTYIKPLRYVSVGFSTLSIKLCVERNDNQTVVGSSSFHGCKFPKLLAKGETSFSLSAYPKGMNARLMWNILFQYIVSGMEIYESNF